MTIALGRRGLACLAVSLLAGALAACGGDGGDGTDSPASAAGGTPIKVGFLNQEKGAAAFPDFGSGARVAGQYINQQLGGVNGRPIELVECKTDGSPESSIDCANKLVEAQVVTVLVGIDFSGDAVLPIIKGAGVPLVGHTAFGPQQSVSNDAFFFGTALPAYGVAPLKVMSDDLGTKSVVYLGSDTPLIRGFVGGAISPAATKLGLELTAVYYPAQNPNLSAVLTTALAKKPDAVFTTASEPDCLGLVKAAKQLSYQGALFAGSCSAFIKQAGGAAEGVYTSSDLWAPESGDQAPTEKQGEIATYRKQMEAAEPKYVDGFAQHTFSSTVDLASVLRTIQGEVTPAAVTKALRATKGLSSFMGQKLTCDGSQWPGQPSACGNGIIVYQVKDGKRKPVTEGFLQARDLVAAN